MGPIAALAVRRAHVLVLAAPGAELLGLRAEAAVRRRGWVVEPDPADADALIVCGTVGERLRSAIEEAWAAIPSPRALRRVESADRIDRSLVSVGRVLGDRALQRAAALRRVPPPAGEPTSAVDGVHEVRLGPVGPDWPTGLLVECRVHRGAVLAATADLLDAAPSPADPLDPEAVAFVTAADRAARVLRLASWPAEALHVRRDVDAVLGGAAPASRARSIRAAERRVRGSVILRAGLRSAPDVRAGLLSLLADTRRLSAGEPVEPVPVDPAGLAALLPDRRLVDVPLLAALGANRVPRA